MNPDYDKPAPEYFSKQQDFDKPSPRFFRKQGNQWTPVGNPVSHPTAPPPEVIGEWWISWDALDEKEQPRLEDFIAIKAARWGADQELEACCKVLEDELSCFVSADLRAARRPRPLSLKAQALEVLEDAELDAAHYNILLRALEALPND
jgi:hypothetical protein